MVWESQKLTNPHEELVQASWWIAKDFAFHYHVLFH